MRTYSINKSSIAITTENKPVIKTTEQIKQNEKETFRGGEINTSSDSTLKNKRLRIQLKNKNFDAALLNENICKQKYK